MSHSHHWAAKFRRPPQGRAAARFYCRHRQNGPRRGELERWDMDGSTCIYVYIYISMCIGLRTCLRHFDCQMASRRWSGFRSNGTSWCRRPKAAKLRWTANARCGAQAMQRWGCWDHLRSTTSALNPLPEAWDCWHLGYLGTRIRVPTKGWYNKREDLPFVEEHAIHQGWGIYKSSWLIIILPSIF